MKKILFLILIITLSGCVSRKTAVKENTKFDVVENVDKTEKETESNKQNETSVIEIKSNVTDKSVIVETVIDYSRPDDVTGEQYKTRETRTETRKDVDSKSEQNEKTISEQKTEIERLTTDNSELKTRLNAALSEKTKTTTRAPFWTYIVAAGIGAAGAIFTRKWLKKIFKP